MSETQGVSRRKASSNTLIDTPTRKLPQSEGSSTTKALSCPDSSSDGSLDHWKGRNEVTNWDEIKLGHRIQPYREYAHCADDLRLLSRFLELSQLSDIHGDAVKLLLRTFKFLRLCNYSVEDICSILAHASAYFLDAFSLCGSNMDASEVGNVLTVLIFIAHCYVQDETCPLRVWHQHLFRKYCPLKTLDAAVMRLLEIKQYMLRLESEDLDRRFTSLLSSVGWNPMKTV